MGTGWLAVPLSTSRLLVRAVEEDDRQGLVALYTDESVRRFLGGALTPAAADAAVSRALAGADGEHFAIVEQAGRRVIGSGDIRDRQGVGPELSYQLAADRWGRGYASESLSAVVTAFLTTSDQPELTALTQSANTRSVALLERLGASLHRREQYKELPQLRYRWSARPQPAARRRP